MKAGLPIDLNPSIEVKLTQYVDSLPDLKKHVSIISGDLHNESMNRGKRFKYYKVGSMFGSSEYCMYGWGNTPPHINYQVFDSRDITLNGTIEF